MWPPRTYISHYLIFLFSGMVMPLKPFWSSPSKWPHWRAFWEGTLCPCCSYTPSGTVRPGTHTQEKNLFFIFTLILTYVFESSSFFMMWQLRRCEFNKILDNFLLFIFVVYTKRCYVAYLISQNKFMYFKKTEHEIFFKKTFVFIFTLHYHLLQRICWANHGKRSSLRFYQLRATAGTWYNSALFHLYFHW